MIVAYGGRYRFVLRLVVPVFGVDELGRGNQPLNLRSWGHRSHIPTKGEEIPGGLSSCPGSPRDLRKPTPRPLDEVVWCWQLVERFDECLRPMRGVVVSSTYKTYNLLL